MGTLNILKRFCWSTSKAWMPRRIYARRERERKGEEGEKQGGGKTAKMLLKNRRGNTLIKLSSKTSYLTICLIFYHLCQRYCNGMKRNQEHTSIPGSTQKMFNKKNIPIAVHARPITTPTGVTSYNRSLVNFGLPTKSSIFLLSTTMVSTFWPFVPAILNAAFRKI